MDWLRAAIPVVMILGLGVVVLVLIKSAKDGERAKVVLEAIETMKDRDQNGETDNLDLPAICRKLGGEWVSGQCE